MHANELGGVKGIYLKPLVLDDAYDPRRVLTSLKKLERWYGITTLVAPQGSPTLAAYLDRVKAGKCEVFFPITGGPQFRTPDNKHIVHFRADYGQEASDLINYTIKQFNSKKFVLMYQNDAFGIPLVEAAHKALERHGITEWVDIPFLREQTTFDDAVKKVLQSDPDALGLFFSSSSLARTFLSKVGSSFFVNKHLFTTAFLEDESFRLFLKSTGIAMTFSFVVPNPWGSELEIVQEYRAEMQKQQASLGCNSLEGYVAGAIFVEALKQIDQPYTGARARAFMETMHNYPLRGLSLTFNPADRGFNLPIWIRGEDGEWVK
jgi:ABC-type branched-subunit amino acid transport system substrate-binding protein